MKMLWFSGRDHLPVRPGSLPRQSMNWIWLCIAQLTLKNRHDFGFPFKSQSNHRSHCRHRTTGQRRNPNKGNSGFREIFLVWKQRAGENVAFRSFENVPWVVVRGDTGFISWSQCSGFSQQLSPSCFSRAEPAHSWILALEDPVQESSLSPSGLLIQRAEV